MISTKNKLFSSKILNSRIISEDITGKERWLGYFIAPVLIMMGYTTLGGTYLNMFFTDVLKVGYIGGGLFLALMPILSRIFGIFTNFIMGRIIDRTRSQQGKVRPWILISCPLLVITGILLYSVPQANSMVQVIWIIISYNLFFSIAFTMYNMSNILMIPLSTRNSKHRDKLAVINNAGATMVPGTLGTIIFPMLILPWLGVNHEKWLTVMSIISILILPGILLQYYFTKERIIENIDKTESEIKTQTLWQQSKGCFSSRYWVIAMIIILLFNFINGYQAICMVYYANWVLGSYNDGITMVLINAIGQSPMGIGVFLLWPLVKKHGKRNIMLIGCVIAIIGLAFCIVYSRNLVMVLVFCFIRSFGYLPGMVLMAMHADVLDHVERLNGFRCDGFSASLYGIIIGITVGLCQGIFNFFLSITGYIPPATDGSIVVQNSSVQNFFIGSFFGVPMVLFILIAFLLLFYNIEKKIPKT